MANRGDRFGQADLLIKCIAQFILLQYLAQINVTSILRI